MADTNITIPQNNGNTKVCTKCGIEHPSDFYYVSKGRWPDRICKKCTNKLSYERRKGDKFGLRLERIKSRISHKKSYIRKGIECYLTKKDLEYLWKRDGADYMDNPTIDRIDNYGDYTLENCRYIENRENAGRNKPIIVRQYDLDGNLIKEFKSINDAAKSVGVFHGNMSKAINGGARTLKGFIWKSVNTVDKEPRKDRKRIAQYDLEGNLVMIYDSAISAASSLGVLSCGISMCARGYNKTSHGYKWKYIDETD